jgi:threonine dehydrogenase-like Zn-dependent dehydrogenase
MVASGHDGAIDQACDLLTPGGTIVLLAYFAAEHLARPNNLIRKEVRLLTSYLSTRADATTAVSGISSGAIRPQPLIGQCFPLERAPTLFAELADGRRRTGKIVLIPEAGASHGT